MMKHIFLLLLCCAATCCAMGQGCADAGFCTAGALKAGVSAAAEGKESGSIGLSGGLGYGEKGTIIFVPQLECNKQVTQRSAVEIKLPYYLASGKLGTYSGVGDIVATYSRDVYRKTDRWIVKGVIGGRFSLGTSDKKQRNGLSLPMPYQANLGTTDLIAGLSIRYLGHYVVAIGLQQPLLHYNNNGYYAGAYAVTDPAYQQYFSSRLLKRKGDALLRLEYDKDWQQDGIAASTLWIYHLGNDEITTPAGDKIEAVNSAGLTLNLTFSYYRNYRNWRFDIGVGGPAIVRENRPDGLTRSLVLTPRATYVFRKKK